MLLLVCCLHCILFTSSIVLTTLPIIGPALIGHVTLIHYSVGHTGGIVVPIMFFISSILYYIYMILLAPAVAVRPLITTITFMLVGRRGGRPCYLQL